ncbi:PstS family phosphate ABC transporter substrate-binding protein [Oscillatoria laete-virens NRMC-F 0139]|nr:PstS family phosphate ABC transporter substrate-binding protein [Oscillatoria laete-virens]MDL5054718.1 PstS family phosphate ABC transporter substrate-binding protein [Oscillatoria laete-virens NRMC-F 0139]
MIKQLIRTAAFAVAAVSITGSVFAKANDSVKITLPPGLPAYKSVSGISGKLNSIGSDTLNNLMAQWAEGFRRFYPNVTIEIEGKGSGTAPTALVKGTAQLGPMSRKMKGSEIDEFEKKYGYKPRLIGVAIDGLAVYVNKDNPIPSLTMQQVDSIFSSTRRRGGKPVTTWGDVGMTGEWATRPISIYGRNSASGTYGFFKEVALKNGDYSSSVKEQPGSASVVQGVEKELGGIGYSGIGYMTSGVRPVPLADKGGPVELTQANCASFKYPIARYLYIYINAAPTGVDPLTREFMLYVLSKEGQEVTVKDGYFPLTPRQVNEFRASAGLLK